MPKDLCDRLREQLLLEISPQDGNMRNKVWCSIRGRFKRGPSDLDTVVSAGPNGHEAMMNGMVNEVNQTTRFGAVEHGIQAQYCPPIETPEEIKRRTDEERRIYDRQRNASRENVRYLRNLIREKYRLDLEVWNQRDVLEADQKIVMKDCYKADAMLQEIRTIVKKWEPDLFGSDEWRVAKRIKESLSNRDHQVMWTDRPPWDARHDNRRESSETSWSQF